MKLLLLLGYIFIQTQSIVQLTYKRVGIILPTTEVENLTSHR
jgi:hypothetical protein